MILASIVDGEAIFADEMPTIAGLYLNRINKGIPLGADPTIWFVVGKGFFSEMISKTRVERKLSKLRAP